MKKPTFSPRMWRLLSGAAIAVLAMFGLRAWLGATDWAGLGQWVGGLGAFAAAWVALDIAKGEVRRERQREHDRLVVHAYNIEARWHIDKLNRERTEVENSGSEPVLDVEIVATHVPGRTKDFRVKVWSVDGPKRVLMPGKKWDPEWAADTNDLESAILATLMAPDSELEITYRDLAGTRWRRIGDRPPVEDDAG